jgi:hypothetical protein
MWGENFYPAAAIYPDSNNIGIWTLAGEGARLYRLGTELDPYDGETGQR